MSNSKSSTGIIIPNLDSDPRVYLFAIIVNSLCFNLPQ